MGREINKLSARAVATLTKPGRYSDGGNLYFSIAANGGRRWVFMYRFAGKQREMGLGSASRAGVPLARARELAAQARMALAAGRDPLEERKRVQKENRAVPSFGEWADTYIKSHRQSWKNEKHAAQWAMTLNRFCAPIRPIPVDAIDTEAVLKVLQPIWERLPETAQRLRGRIENVIDAAKARGFRTGENPARWRGHLENLLSRPKKLTRGHHAALPYDQVPAFMKALSLHPSLAVRALEWTILSACRSGEVLNARWEELDLEKAIWTIPAARMKSGKEHRVPLSTGLLALAERLALMRRDAFLFPGQRFDRPLSSMAMAMQLRRMKREDITVHGFRSSFRDWAGEETSFAREVCEQALAHSIGSKTEAAYRRGDTLEKRRGLMQAWADFCLASEVR